MVIHKPMKKIIAILVLMLAFTVNAFAEIKYIQPYTRNDGTSVSGHWKDTSHDGNPYNNANYLGYNRKTPEGIY